MEFSSWIPLLDAAGARRSPGIDAIRTRRSAIEGKIDMSKQPAWRSFWGAATTAAVVLIGSLTACSSSGTGGGTTTPQTTATSAGGNSAQAEPSGLKEAEDFLAPYLKSATAIGVTEPLTAAPPAGKKVYWLEGNLADIKTITGGFKAATAALGWSLHTLSYDTTNPQAVNAAMEQAVQQGADYIAISGTPTASFASALKKARAKNIPIFDSFSTNAVEGTGNGIYANFGGPKNVELDGTLTGAYDAVYWKGKANIAFVNDPDFAVLTALQKADEATTKKYCPSCAYDVLNVSTQQLVQGAIPQVVVSYLQSHPKVNTLRFAIGAMSTGVVKAMKSVGLNQKLIITGSDPEQPNFQALIDGTETAWVGLPRAAAAWYDVDGMARMAAGMTLATGDSIAMPAQIFTSDTVPHPAPEDYVPFSGYEAQFKALWKVS
jgi:ABC-type sugar transport system substrate-binding protein